MHRRGCRIRRLTLPSWFSDSERFLTMAQSRYWRSEMIEVCETVVTLYVPTMQPFGQEGMLLSSHSVIKNYDCLRYLPK